MANQKHINASIAFEHRVDFFRNELINLGSFDTDIKTIGRNLTENFEIFASYKFNRMYINDQLINNKSKTINTIKKATSIPHYSETTNPSVKKKINKLYSISDKMLDLRKLL